MGNYLNPDNSKFQRAVNSDIYVLAAPGSSTSVLSEFQIKGRIFP